MAKLDSDVQNKFMMHATKVVSEEEYKDVYVAETTANFKIVDPEGKGLIKVEAFRDFMKKTESDDCSKFDDNVISSFEELDEWYNAFNSLVPEVDGVSLQDIFMYYPLMRQSLSED